MLNMFCCSWVDKAQISAGKVDTMLNASYGPRYKIVSPLYSISFFLNSSSGAYYVNSLFLTTIEGRFNPNFPDGALWKAYII